MLLGIIMGYNTEHPSALQNNGQVVNGHRKEKGVINFATYLLLNTSTNKELCYLPVLDDDSTMRSIIFWFKMILPMVIGFTFLIIKSRILFIF